MLKSATHYKTKKTFFLSLLAALFLISCSSEQEETAGAIVPNLGVNYVVLNNQMPLQQPAKHEVLEFFSYSCIHCFRAKDSVANFLATKPEGVNYIQIPVSFGGNSLFAQIFYTFEQLDVLEQMHLPFFDAIHKEKLPIRTHEDFFSWMNTKGFDSEKVKVTFNSTIVRFKTNRSFEIVNQYGVNSTPSFVIDGLYRTGPSFTNSHEKTMELISQLVQS